MGPTSAYLGKPVERRVLHSIRTLSIETKLHPKRLRKLLAASGTLPQGAADLVDGNCTGGEFCRSISRNSFGRRKPIVVSLAISLRIDV